MGSKRYGSWGITVFLPIVSILVCAFLCLKIIEYKRALYRTDVDSAILCLSVAYGMHTEGISDNGKNRCLVIMLGCLDRLEALCSDDDSYVTMRLRSRTIRDAVSYALESTAKSNTLYKINMGGDAVKCHMKFPLLNSLIGSGESLLMKKD